MSRAEKLEQAKNAIEQSRVKLTEKTKTDQSQLKLSGFPEAIESIKSGDGNTIKITVPSKYNGQEVKLVKGETTLINTPANNTVEFEVEKAGRWELKDSVDKIFGNIDVYKENNKTGFKANVWVYLKKQHLIPYNGKNYNLIFTDIKAPEATITTDLSAENDNSVVRWLDDDNQKCYISSQQEGIKIQLFNGPGGMNVKSYFDAGQRYTYLLSIDFKNADTNQVTDMSYYFHGCDKLKTIDLSNFDTSNVTAMYCMFYECSSLKKLDLSNFDTSNVTKMQNMFYKCQALHNLNLSEFNTSSVENMSNMFDSCGDLPYLDLTSFDTSKVSNMYAMFNNCSDLSVIQWDKTKFKTDLVTDMSRMFSNCSHLFSLDISGFTTNNVERMDSIFDSCESLEYLDLKGWDTFKVTDMSYMFNKCSSLISLNISNFDTSNVTNMEHMFSLCNELDYLTTSNSFYNTSLVENMSFMFEQCNKINLSDYVSRLKTNSVKTMNYMFENCSEITTLNLRNFDITNLTSITGLFYGCKQLKNIYANDWTTNQSLVNSTSVFTNCQALPNYSSDKVKGDMCKPTSMGGYFTAP